MLTLDGELQRLSFTMQDPNRWPDLVCYTTRGNSKIVWDSQFKPASKLNWNLNQELISASTAIWVILPIFVHSESSCWMLKSSMTLILPICAVYEHTWPHLKLLKFWLARVFITQLILPVNEMILTFSFNGILVRSMV